MSYPINRDEEEMRKILTQEIEDDEIVPIYSAPICVAYAVAPVLEFPQVIKEHNKRTTGMAYKDSELVRKLRDRFSDIEDVCDILEIVESI